MAYGNGFLTSWEIDADDRIVSVDQGFETFADQNDAAGLPARVIGRPLWDFIANREVRQLYWELLSKVRSERRAMEVPYRCDSPTCRRYLSLAITPLASGGVVFVSRTIREEPRPAMRLLERSDRPRGELLSMCSWCKKVKTPAGWTDVEQAVVELELLTEEHPRPITHGMCPDCFETLMKQMAPADEKAQVA